MDWEKLTQKKTELSKKKLSKAFTKNLEDWLRIELTYTSNAIEGNTLTRIETALVVEKGITSGKKSLVEYLEAKNHAAAFDFILQLSIKLKTLKEKDILAIHQLILSGINDQIAGRYRNIPVRISGSRVVLPNPIKVPTLMKEFVKWLNTKQNIHPVELAALAHYKLVTIHPFVDGNGRCARLLMNLILLLHGYPLLIITKRQRASYIKSLEKAQMGGSIDDYIQLIYTNCLKSFDYYKEI